MAIWSSEIKDLEKLYESFKGQLPDLEKELGQLIRFDDPNVILLYSRRCLEVIITDLCECELKRPRKTEPLKGIIDRLDKEGRAPSYIVTSMDSLNRLAAFGTHPKEYDPEQVRPVLINLSTIFKWYLKYKNTGSNTPAERQTSKVEFFNVEKEQSVQKTEVLVDFTGPINSETIESILIKYKQSEGYKKIDKITGKRVYAIIVECLDNISKHSCTGQVNQSLPNPNLSVIKQQNKIAIITRNFTTENNKKEIVSRIDQINNLDETDLKVLYDKIINCDLKPHERGAGLGFILMALKSGKKIQYSFTESDHLNSFEEVQIQVSISFPKKLIIKRTASSPKIYFDPYNNIYEISGESRPDDVPGFYEPVLKWLEEFSIHLDNLNISTKPIEFVFNFEYFNSLSAKYILDLCKQLANISSKAKNIIMKWHYEEDDMDMLEAGREMSRISKIPVEFIQND
jgi:hypothetical protein